MSLPQKESDPDGQTASAAHRARQRRLILLAFVLALGVYSLLRFVIAPVLNPLLGL